ncbi:MAG TPA: peptidoglycan DD-metalloendopeptidase family protein [Pedococcus sp.]|jgi:murein DD-endopeptidase MepM/ murein hydrolase activator NlpD|nr:peptidoglycan DD-metalloendopeptidase family protein [Pedococcus sp.]
MTPVAIALIPTAALVLAVGTAPSTPGGRPDDAATRRDAPTAASPSNAWAWPLSAPHPVLRPFAAPASRYGPGHRGIDVAGASGVPVRAVDSGTVSHVGVVAGTRTVTLLHANGLRSTYEPVAGSVAGGQVVRRGETIGTLVSDGTHCPPRACLHLGAVNGRTYLDPLTLLTGTRVRLLPLMPPPQAVLP